MGWKNSCGLRWVSVIVFSIAEKNVGYLVGIGRERLNGNTVFVSIRADKGNKGRDREAKKRYRDEAGQRVWELLKKSYLKFV